MFGAPEALAVAAPLIGHTGAPSSDGKALLEFAV